MKDKDQISVRVCYQSNSSIIKISRKHKKTIRKKNIEHQLQFLLLREVNIIVCIIFELCVHCTLHLCVQDTVHPPGKKYLNSSVKTDKTLHYLY